MFGWLSFEAVKGSDPKDGVLQSITELVGLEAAVALERLAASAEA